MQRVTSESSAFRPVPRTGVIFVTNEAEARGYRASDAAWCNLGQGQPETGLLPGGPRRLTELEVRPDSHDYAPVAGLWELREAVAEHYNRRYRQGRKSRYSAENVAICGGGRLALARAAVALGEINLGHFLPDYTAYEELLGVFRLFHPIPILLEGDKGYAFSVEELRREIQGKGLSAVLLSNPANPTGRTLAGEELADWVSCARTQDCALLVDEFYSHYCWSSSAEGENPTVSAAHFVEDVENDPVILFDGLTKNWRYPGLRVSWTLGPKSVIDAVSSAGSFLDGGGSRPAQQAAVGLLEASVVEAEIQTIRETFLPKREFLVSSLREMGIGVDLVPEGGFYVWGSVAGLPAAMNTDMTFFQRALEQQVITVPGTFFDINPGQRRQTRASRFSKYLRFSFGPSLDVLERACQRLTQMIKDEL